MTAGGVEEVNPAYLEDASGLRGGFADRVKKPRVLEDAR